MEPAPAFDNEGDKGKEPRSPSTISINAAPFVPSTPTPLMNCYASRSKALSPDAPAFYPKNYSSYAMSHLDARAMMHDQQQRNEEADNWASDCTAEEVLLELRSAIRTLINDPGHFEQIMPSLARKLASLMQYGNCSVLLLVIDEIFDQSIDEVNFRYTGARMCSYLSHSYEPAFRNFQQVFLSRCNKEHQSIMSVPPHVQPPPLQHVIGYSFFIGELLLNMKEGASSQVIPLFTAQINQLLMYLLDNKSKEALQCSVKLLKLTGAVLEENLPNLDEIFERMNVIIKEQDLPEKIVCLMQSVMNQRLNSWGQRNNEPLMSSGAGDSIDSPLDEPPINNLSDNELYNNSDSLTSEEREMANMIEECDAQNCVDQYWIGDQKMDDETASAFEQFMAESQTAANRSMSSLRRSDGSANI